jgi:hypothetical protein
VVEARKITTGNNLVAKYLDPGNLDLENPAMDHSCGDWQAQGLVRCQVGWVQRLIIACEHFFLAAFASAFNSIVGRWGCEFAVAIPVLALTGQAVGLTRESWGCYT